MKKSELKKYIKENIVETLTEEEKVNEETYIGKDAKKPIQSNPKFSKLQQNTKTDTLKKLDKGESVTLENQWTTYDLYDTNDNENILTNVSEEQIKNFLWENMLDNGFSGLEINIHNLNETNSDGTISPDEEEERSKLIQAVKSKMEDIINYINNKSSEIGGSFRSPGIKAEIKNILKQYINNLNENVNENLDAKYSPTEEYKYAVKNQYIIGFQGREDILYFKNEEEAKKYVNEKPSKREYLGANPNLNEMARKAVLIKLGNKTKAEKVKKAYEGRWMAKMIDVVIAAGKDGISQPALAAEIDKQQQGINTPVKQLIDSGVFAIVGATKPKEEPKTEPKPKEKEEDDVEVKDDWNKVDDEDKSPDEDNEDKEATKTASKVNSKATKLDQAIRDLKNVDAEMKTLVNKYKTAEGAEKEKIVADLKSKTQIKKELEKLKEKYANEIV